MFTIWVSGNGILERGKAPNLHPWTRLLEKHELKCLTHYPRLRSTGGSWRRPDENFLDRYCFWLTKQDLPLVPFAPKQPVSCIRIDYCPTSTTHSPHRGLYPTPSLSVMTSIRIVYCRRSTLEFTGCVPAAFTTENPPAHGRNS